MSENNSHGFTLIELSIVLVIIGLIVGGVLVGQDLIQAAQIRATIAQIEKYSTAVNAFRSKYGGLPGDITNPTDYGMVARAGYSGHGDGDGWIETCGAGPPPGSLAGIGCENVLFWSDLSVAQMVDGNFTAAVDNWEISMPSKNVPLYFPRAKIGRGNFIMPILVNANSTPWNMFLIANIQGSNAAGVVQSYGTMTPLEVSNIDSKVDDGLPKTGKVMSVIDTGNFIQPENGLATDCSTGATNSYNLGSSTGNKPLCQLVHPF